FFQAEDGIRDSSVTGVQTCALPISRRRGAVGMTFAERVQAVKDVGFLERQARFLVTVLLHAGVCLTRQYCTFAGIARGQVVHDRSEGRRVGNGDESAGVLAR